MQADAINIAATYGLGADCWVRATERKAGGAGALVSAEHVLALAAVEADAGVHDALGLDRVADDGQGLVREDVVLEDLEIAVQLRQPHRLHTTSSQDGSRMVELHRCIQVRL